MQMSRGAGMVHGNGVRNDRAQDFGDFAPSPFPEEGNYQESDRLIRWDFSRHTVSWEDFSQRIAAALENETAVGVSG